MEEMPLGKIAYNAYCETRNWKSFNGDALPPFERQSPELQQAWNNAGLAVAEYATTLEKGSV